MKTLRTQLGFSQRQFAALIGIPRTVIAMYEKGQRNLPTKAALQLAQIQLLLQQNKAGKQPTHTRLINHQQAENLKIEKLMKADARKVSGHILRLTMEIGNMRERYTQLSQKLSFLQVLMQEATPATRQMSLLQNLELSVVDAMQHCGPSRQLIAEYRLQTLNARQQAATGVISRIQKINTPVKNSRMDACCKDCGACKR